MIEFVCPKCKEIEVVSSDTYEVLHHHNGLFFRLNMALGAPVDGKDLSNNRFIKEMNLIEMDPSKTYLILFNPVDIDIVGVIKTLESKPIQIKQDCLFVPCRFSQDAQGYSTEMIALESLDIIEEWLKERKAQVAEFHVPHSV